LPECAEQVKNEASTGRRSINRLGDGAESNTAFLQRRHRLDQMWQRTAETIQLPDDQHVAFRHILKRRSQSRAIGPCPGGTILKYLCASGRRKGIDLQCRVLVDGADSGVTNVRQGIWCPLSRPETMLSGLPTEVQGFRTFRTWPLNVRLTDSRR
jgi:hypothetical protein